MKDNATNITGSFDEITQISPNRVIPSSKELRTRMGDTPSRLKKQETNGSVFPFIF